jgi:hypothetical protein
MPECLLRRFERVILAVSVRYIDDVLQALETVAIRTQQRLEEFDAVHGMTFLFS